MDWKLALEEERAALMRLVALLYSLADLAERACGRSRAVRGFILWLLRPAEAVARNFVMGTPDTPLVPIPLRQASYGPAEAMQLAQDLRDLAHELECQAALAFAVDDDDGAQNGPARFGVRRALRLAAVLNFTNVLAFLSSALVTPRLAGFHDTS